MKSRARHLPQRYLEVSSWAVADVPDRLVHAQVHNIEGLHRLRVEHAMHVLDSCGGALRQAHDATIAQPRIDDTCCVVNADALRADQ